MTDEQNYGFGTTFLAFSLGALIGGCLALLTAPRPGPGTRKKLHGMVDETRGKLSEMTENAVTRIKQAIQEGRQALEENAELSPAFAFVKG